MTVLSSFSSSSFLMNSKITGTNALNGTSLYTTAFEVEYTNVKTDNYSVNSPL